MTDLDGQIAAACDSLRGRLAPGAEPIVAVACIRDEQDVVERFVRHNLSVVDGLIVLDHRSRDRTPGILAALAAEGLPLALCRETRPGKHQGDWMSRMARAAATRLGAHPVVPLDADEFLTGSPPAAMRSLLKAVPRGGVTALEWMSYVPLPEDPAGEVDVLARITHHRAREVSRTLKLAVGGDLAADPGFLWSHGMHRAVRGLDDLSPEPQSPALSLAHVPVRSVEQLRAKVAVSRLANAVRTGKTDYLCYDWLESLVPLVPEMTADDLRRAAIHYLCERDFGDDEVVADPVAPLGGPLRHTTGEAADAFHRLLWSAMDLALLCAARPEIADSNPDAPSILEQNKALRAAFGRLREHLHLDGASPDALATAVIATRPALRDVPARTLARELLWRIRRRIARMFRP